LWSRPRSRKALAAQAAGAALVAALLAVPVMGLLDTPAGQAQSAATGPATVAPADPDVAAAQALVQEEIEAGRLAPEAGPKLVELMARLVMAVPDGELRYADVRGAASAAAELRERLRELRREGDLTAQGYANLTRGLIRLVR